MPVDDYFIFRVPVSRVRLSVESLLTVGSAAQKHIRVNCGRGEKDIRKDEFARNKARNPGDEHEADDDVAFCI